MTDHTGPDRIGEPFTGVCDGCPDPTPRTVRRASGDWGTAVVCPWHAEHVD